MSHLILKNTRLNPLVCHLEIMARDIAVKAQPGQFIILRVDEKGERIPLTIYQAHPEKGTIELIVQEAGATTLKLCRCKVKEEIVDIIGPLGKATHIQKYGKVVCIGGGVGIAEVYPLAKALKEAGNEVVSIIGSRNKELLILENEMRNMSDVLYITTDDGSYKRKGFVSDVLKGLLEKEKFDMAFAVGPVPMMNIVAGVTRPFNLKTLVSLNSIMVDGTGMCGSCRVTIGREVKFVCVDGPDFDAHQVDFRELSSRQGRFLNQEKISAEKIKEVHKRCHLK